MISLLLIGLASAGPLNDRSYERAIDLVDGLYLYQDQLDATDLLRASAEKLADELHWLRVENQGAAVNLMHGDGTRIGSVSVATLATLPMALAAVEDLVRASGYPLGDVDVRLAALQGMTNGLDRYSRVLSGDGLDRFDVRLKGTIVGVGLRLTIVDDRLQISSVNVGEPAQKAGLSAGDVLTRIDGRSTVNMPARDANRRIRGVEGSSVRLSYLRDGVEREVVVPRAQIVVPNVVSRVLPDDVGYVRISHMSQRTVENLLAELAALDAKGAMAHGLVVDLRRNTGGSMKESARTVDEFVDAGMLLRTAGPDGKPVRNLQARMDAELGGHIPDVPVVVLVDERTASGAEILAGALLELDRAVLVGTRTYGKGTVQKIYPLGEEARLKLTVAQYILENERHIADHGLVPDVAIGNITLDSYGVHYEDWSPDPSVAREAIVPWVQESWGWRQEDVLGIDVPEELARRTVLAAKGGDRADALVALRATAATLAEEQRTRLTDALAAQGIDWSPADTPAGKAPPVLAKVAVRKDPERENLLIVTGTVTNRSEVHTLHQTSIELSSAFSGWEGLSMPIGRLEPGATLSGEVRVPLRNGIRPREDEVSIGIRADGYGVLPAGSTILNSQSTARPRVSATIRLEGEGSTRRAVVDLRNHTPVDLTGVEVHFAYPGDVDVELLDRASRVPSLPAGALHQFGLEVAIGPSAKGSLPLRLEVESPGTGRIARWPLELPLDGTAVVLNAPRVETIASPKSHAAGSVSVPIVVRDDGNLDHVVVFHNGEKVAWAPGGTPEVTLLAEVDLMAGRNQFDVVAQDELGLSTRERFVIRGIAADGVVSP